MVFCPPVGERSVLHSSQVLPSLFDPLGSASWRCIYASRVGRLSRIQFPRANERVRGEGENSRPLQQNHFSYQIAIQQAASALVFPRAQPEDLVIETAAVMAEMAPQNATEAMLSVQMVAVHGAAMMFLRDATLPDQTPVGREANVLRATRLMRVFNEQLEAMRKLQGKGGRQQVTTSTSIKADRRLWEP